MLDAPLVLEESSPTVMLHLMLKVISPAVILSS